MRLHLIVVGALALAPLATCNNSTGLPDYQQAQRRHVDLGPWRGEWREEELMRRMLRQLTEDDAVPVEQSAELERAGAESDNADDKHRRHRSPMVHDYSAGILALCAVMRDQRADIREWVDYHYLYGVDKFYIFDDDSKDPALDILQDYISNGVVHYIEHAKEFLGVEHPLQPGFDYCIKEWGPLHKWMGFIDIDEFIVIAPPMDPLRPGISIPDVLERYAASAAVALNWKVFGSSGFEMRPGGVAHYTKCTPPEAYPSYFVKCIVQPRHTIRSLCVGHEFEYHPGGRVAVNVEGNSTTLKRSWSIPPAYSYLYINHYQVKSKQEFFEMKIPRGTGDGNSGPNEEYFQHIEAAATADCMPLQWPRPRTVGGG